MFDIAGKRARVEDLEKQTAAPGFWEDAEMARSVMQELNELKRWIEPWEALERRTGDLLELGELIESDGEPGLEEEFRAEVGELEAQVEELEFRNMLRGTDSERDALLTIHPGAGGTDSQDWAEMLMRMYTRWAESHDLEVAVLDMVPAEEAGIKSVTLEMRGRYAYGYLQAEKGVHRLVRISPFDQQARRHTSFASVFVYPVVDDSVEVDVSPEDLRIDTYRASGKGGQHVNKTDSAVRITHIPTGIVVSCQQERSQHRNKNTAMKMLRAALYDRALEERQKERDKIDAAKTEIAWGNQIRSYVFQPYTLVKDHRTGVERSDVQGVMQGDLDVFILGFLKRYGAQAV
ncbi:MAG: peptide chain release factor 2 [Gemmatimonadales bacterium]